MRELTHTLEPAPASGTVRVPAQLEGLLIVLVPTTPGPSPRLFADFDVRSISPLSSIPIPTPTPTPPEPERTQR